MDVMNRKLFASREARNRLRNMGGIMASYPELMQEAQQYQAGGPAAPVRPPYDAPPQLPLSTPLRRFTPNTVPIPSSLPSDTAGEARAALPAAATPSVGTKPAAITYEQWLRMTPAERERAGYPRSRIGGELFFERLSVGMGTEDDDQLFTPEGPLAPAEERISGEARRAARTGLREAEEPAEDSSASFGSEIRTGGKESPEEEQEVLPMTGPERRAARAGAALEPLQVGPSTRRLDSRKTRAAQREEERLTQPEEEQAPEQAPEQDPMAERQDRLTPDPDEDEKTLRERFDERLSLFKEVLGTESDQKAQDKAMQLAMIGLAIASGQSPDALTNIAQGALAGLESMSAQEAERRQQQRELRSSALESVLDELTSEREAEATAAEKAYARETAERVAMIRAAGGGGSNMLAQEPASRVFNAQRTALENALSAGTLAVPEGVDPQDYVNQVAAQRAAQQVQNLMLEGAYQTEDERLQAQQLYNYYSLLGQGLTEEEINVRMGMN